MTFNLLKSINENGYALVPNFFNVNEVKNIRNKLLSIYAQYELGDQIELPGKSTHHQYSTGKSMRIYPSAYDNFAEFVRFKESWLTQLTNTFFEGANNKGLQVFSSYETLSYNEVNELPRNSYMHVDPYHSLKFFSYLTNTTKENGALQVIPGTSWIGRRIREENNIEDLLNSDLYTFKKSKYYDSNLENKIEYVEGNAGDLVILDTDVIHCGGILLKPELERLTIIYHNRK
jgi:ectoine hydroxylase-related dioxygenase (phytanoyl-CoA dioxygenase family)